MVSGVLSLHHIRRETHQRALVTKVGNYDQVNEQEIHKQPMHSGWRPDDDQAPGVELNAGLSVLVFQVVNIPSKWVGSIWLTDAAGMPVKGLRVTLGPYATK